MAPKYANDQPSGYTNKIKNVAVVGASGQSGSPITAELLKTAKHVVTAITRTDSKSSFPDGVKIARANYDDHSSLVNAMRGQDALVITMNVMAPADSVAKLVEAAIDAGVPWVLPNEWGGDYTDASINKDTMLGDDKLAIRKLVETKGADKTAWIAVACGFWYDYSLPGEMITFGFDFGKKEITFYDGGNLKLPYSTLPYCGQGVAKLLSLPILPHDADDKSPCLEDYRNQICRIHAYRLDQKDMLASVLRVTGDKESDWTVKHGTAEARYNQGKEVLKSGNRMGWRQMLYTRMFYPSNPVKGPDEFSDERLGLKQPDVDEATKWALDQVEKKKESS